MDLRLILQLHMRWDHLENSITDLVGHRLLLVHVSICSEYLAVELRRGATRLHMPSLGRRHNTGEILLAR